jgi:hypothetical protein
MKGIQIKLVKNDGVAPDVETVYFATMRSCQELREHMRAIIRADAAFAAAARRYVVAAEAVEAARADAEIDEAGAAYESRFLAYNDASESQEAARFEFLKKGFLAAGYDPATAERLACEIPSERLKDVIAAAKTGAGMLDFSQPSKQ